MTKPKNKIFRFCHGLLLQHLLYSINIKIIVYTKGDFIMKKTIKKLINTIFALLLIFNLCFSGSQTTISSYSEDITPFGIVGDLEIK